MSCQKLSDEVEHHKQNHSRLRKGMELFRRNFVLRMEFDQVSALYAEASIKLANSQESLVTLQSQYDASIHELKEKLSIVGTELQEARAKLLNAKYLVESLKETEDYCQMEDDCLQYGVTLAVGIVNAKYPNVGYSFVQPEVNAWRDNENRSLNSMGVFASQPLPTAPHHDILSKVSLTFLTQEPQ